MKTLIKNVNIISSDSTVGVIRRGFIEITDKIISYVGESEPIGIYDSIIDGTNKTAIAGLYNCHAHVPMTLFRGYAEELPLTRWLNERIFPIEDKLDSDGVYWASMLANAEMMAAGIVSYSDMYFFSESIVKAAIESGMKANISRSTVSFDDKENLDENTKLKEALSLYNTYNGENDGKIKIDMSIHAEYTTNARFVEYFVEKVGPLKTNIQLHLSETSFEHYDCVERLGQTPTSFFAKLGVFDKPCVAAHCIYVDEADIDILHEYDVTVAHNPVSNLKLGSGIADIPSMLQKGIRIVLGTDGCASNNNTDILQEMKYASLLQKGLNCDPTLMKANDIIDFATINGAVSQGRYDSGSIKQGNRADIVLLDFNKPHLRPCYDLQYSLVFSARADDVCLTMMDGEIIYKNGEYLTIDIEKVYYNINKTLERMA